MNCEDPTRHDKHQYPIDKPGTSVASSIIESLESRYVITQAILELLKTGIRLERCGEF